MQLSRVDLNLIPALAMLLDERSVSRAAEAVGLSQSAMSRALQRLRRTLGDELLVRAGDGYRLTPVGEQLKVEVGEIVPRLSAMFLNRDFDPAVEFREFRMTGSDYAITTFGAQLFARVVSAAPDASVRFFPWHSGVLQELQNGELDIVFTAMHMRSPIRTEVLFTDSMVAVVADGHPWSDKSSVTLDEYLEARHLMIDMKDGLQPSVDAVLTARGMKRRAGLTMPYHVIAPAALFGTELVLSIPQRMLADCANRHGSRVHVIDLPAEINALPYHMCWHPRVEHDQAHQWLREQVRETIAGTCPTP